MASDAPGQDSGHGLRWADVVAHGVARYGALAGLADALAARRGHVESVESIERALRRLRAREGDGGLWGARLLALVGVPHEVSRRLRWMGHYHSRFADLPTSLGGQLLRPWWATPVVDTPQRVWLELARLSLGLRERADVREVIDAVFRAGPTDEALAEALLARAYAVSRADPAAAETDVAAAGEVIAALPASEDRACLWARWIDHQGYVCNVRRRDHAAAVALYRQIPDAGPPFARVRHHTGMGWSLVRLGDRDRARWHAERAVEIAGDGGHLRLRVMALRLVAELSDGAERAAVLARAVDVARALEDPTLVDRLGRSPTTGAGDD